MADSSPNENALNQGRDFVWHEVVTDDIEGTVAFYTGALDCGTVDMPMGDMGDYRMLTRNGVPICGITATHSGVGPHWAVYLSVDDVDARIAASESLGATLIVPAMDVPTIGRMGMIRDPQGAHIWLFKSTPQSE